MQLSAEQREQLETMIGAQAARGVLHVYLFMRSFPVEKGRKREVILDSEMELMPTSYHRNALRLVRLLGSTRLTARITTAILSLILRWRIKLCALTGSRGFRTLGTGDPFLERT